MPPNNAQLPEHPQYSELLSISASGASSYDNFTAKEPFMQPVGPCFSAFAPELMSLAVLRHAYKTCILPELAATAMLWSGSGETASSYSLAAWFAGLRQLCLDPVAGPPADSAAPTYWGFTDAELGSGFSLKGLKGAGLLEKIPENKAVATEGEDHCAEDSTSEPSSTPEDSRLFQLWMKSGVYELLQHLLKAAATNHKYRYCGDVLGFASSMNLYGLCQVSVQGTVSVDRDGKICESTFADGQPRSAEQLQKMVDEALTCVRLVAGLDVPRLQPGTYAVGNYMISEVVPLLQHDIEVFPKTHSVVNDLTMDGYRALQGLLITLGGDNVREWTQVNVDNRKAEWHRRLQLAVDGAYPIVTEEMWQRAGDLPGLSTPVPSGSS